jgi:hypothetical protein
MRRFLLDGVDESAENLRRELVRTVRWLDGAILIMFCAGGGSVGGQ